MYWLLTILVVLLAVSSGNAQELKTVLLDTSVTESFTCVRADTMGRLFVGGGNTLFVYEPNDQGGYGSRRILHRLPLPCRISDIELRGNDLYILTPTALYVLCDGTGNRENLQRKKLIWGVPHSEAQQGLHALAWGPEGDLYFSMGDALGDYASRPPDHWGYWTFFTQPGGTKMPYSGVGGVFRCRPDGSGLKVVAGGLRNPRGLAFDRYWNLFGNDHITPISGKFLHVTPHTYFSWPRGLPGQGVDCRTESLPGITFSSQSYYDEMLFPAKYRHQLLAATADKIIHASLEPTGASFKTITHLLFQQKEAQPIGVTVGRGGRIFVTLKHSSGRSELVMITTDNDPATHPFEPYHATKATAEKLWHELSNPSWQRRYRAHIELVRRGGTLLKEANKKLLTAKADDPNLHHLIWLAAISQQRSLHLFALIDHADPRVRVQVLRTLAEFPDQLLGEQVFMKFLLDENLQVQHTAVLAHFAPKIAWNRPIQKATERGPACSKDAYLRQAATLLLAEKATRKEIEALCERFDAELRFAGVLAAGYRLTLPAVTRPIAQQLPLAKPRASACIFADADGKVDLCKLGRVGQFSVAEHWKADMHTEDQELLFKLLRKMLKDDDAPTRMQAAYFLSLLVGRASDGFFK